MNSTRLVLLFLAAGAVALAGWPATTAAQRANPGDGPSTRPADRQTDRQSDRQPDRQRDNPRRQRANLNQALRTLAAAAESFDLTDAQSATLEEVLTGAREDLRRLYPGLRTLEPAERRERMRAFQTSVIAEVKALLDAEDQPLLEGRLREQVRTTFRNRGNRDADDRPSTRPTRPDREEEGVADEPERDPSRPNAGPRVGGQAGRYVQRMVRAVLALDLSADQREQVDTLAASLRTDLRQILEENEGDRQAITRGVRERLADFRNEVSEVLEPVQREQLRERLEAMRPDNERRDNDRRPGMTPAGAAEEGMGMSMMGEAAASNPAPIAPSSTDSEFLARLEAPAGVTVGQKLPDGLQLLTLQNRQVSLQSQLAEHRPTIILLGSASSPTFRDRVGDLAWLRTALSTPSGRSADVLLIYTREQYPAGDWNLERNETDGFLIERHPDAETRTNTAMNLRRWGGLDWPGLEVLADTMDDATLVALTGSVSAVGNFAFVVQPDGTVIGRQNWFDPTGIPALVAAAE